MPHFKEGFRPDVIVLGAGAAGLMCAITAAQRGRSVLVLEKSNKLGKKILMSGGGRCNFTNLSIDADNYISSNPHFCRAALKRYQQWDFINLVEKHHIEYEERLHGQLFCQHSAKDILSMLIAECDLVNVKMESNVIVNAVQTGQSGFTLKLSRNAAENENGFPRSIDCSSLVVATGALSIPTLGGSGQGYDIAKQFEHSLVPSRAGLVPFTFSDYLKPLCEKISGVAIDVEVECRGRLFRESLLFTHRGMSGPAMLQISNYWKEGDHLKLDLLPDVDGGRFLLEQKSLYGKQQLQTILSKHLPKAFVLELQSLFWQGREGRPLSEFSDASLIDIGKVLNQWRVKPSGTEGYRTAEVTLGGVDTTDISSKTMESKRQKDLYFIGEVLDVSGHLGGYNFQWAWSSAYSAGLVA
jgi:predicted Rossmann fold flavoprotein